MASFQKRGENSWLLVVEAGYDSKGKRVRRTRTVRIDDEKLLKTTKRLNDYLKLELSKFQLEIESGEYIKPEKMLLSDFVKQWENWAVRELSPKTLENYLIQINNRILPEFGHKRVDEIKPMHIVSFMDKLQQDGARQDEKKGKLSPSMIKYVFRVMKNIFNRAVEWQVVKTSPMKDMKSPKEERSEIDVYDEQEVFKLLQALESEPLHWRVMIKLALFTGMRRGELLGLEWKHIDFESGVIDIKQSLSHVKEQGYIIKEPKTKNSVRKVKINDSLIPELKALKVEENKKKMKAGELWEGGEHFFVFASWHGKPFYPSSVRTWWGRFTERHKLKYIRFHDLRHTSATFLINQGVHAKTISAILGHADIKTTMNIYGHTLQSAIEEAANHFDVFTQNKNDEKEAK